MNVDVRSTWRSVALETTLLVHGVPREHALQINATLVNIVRRLGAEPTLIGVLDGCAVVGMTEQELSQLLEKESVTKVNTANMGLVLHSGQSGATTVSGTMELAAMADVRLFATGGVGGVHRGYGQTLDISSDLAAFTRFPVAVVSSGVKSILDVEATREAMESLGIPVIGYQTDEFPAFYLRGSGAGVDARFDDVDELADYIHFELERTGRGVLIANPIPVEAEIPQSRWDQWLAEAHIRAASAQGRAITPAILSALHEVSDGATLRANLALVESNVALAAKLAR